MNVQVQTLKVGDVILPPAREIQLWMRRELQKRGLPEAALHLTVTNIREGNPDKRGRRLIISTDQTAEWNADCRVLPFVFKARPETPWPRAA